MAYKFIPFKLPLSLWPQEKRIKEPVTEFIVVRGRGDLTTMRKCIFNYTPFTFFSNWHSSGRVL